jgi:CheY-like chemotaxis protein
MEAVMAGIPHSRSPILDTLVVLNGRAGIPEGLECVLGPGCYDLSFAASAGFAYHLIRRQVPDLIVLCVSVERADDFALLTALQIDPATSHIPVLLCDVGPDDTRDHGTLADDAVDDFPRRTRPAARFN